MTYQEKKVDILQDIISEYLKAYDSFSEFFLFQILTIYVLITVKP